MRKRPITRFRPRLERLEEKIPLSAGTPTASFMNLSAGSRTQALPSANSSGVPGTDGDSPRERAIAVRQRQRIRQGSPGSQAHAHHPISQTAVKPNFGFLVYRITNPNIFNNQLIPPFKHVLVQDRQPVPGQEYNILSVVVRNGTAQTFDASSGFTVKLSGQHQSTPILTGDEQWKPGENFVFYVMTKQYYPLSPQTTSGFVFDLGGARSVAIPGPSGIFLRLRYDPARFGQTLDWITAFGPGAQGGKGVKFGLPNTQINEFVSASTHRRDFGGYF